MCDVPNCARVPAGGLAGPFGTLRAAKSPPGDGRATRAELDPRPGNDNDNDNDNDRSNKKT
jgi:hypothetical protein